MFIVVTGFIGLSIVNQLKCVSMSNQECKVRPQQSILAVISLHFILTVFL